MNAAAYSQELIHQGELLEGLSGNEEKSLTYHSFHQLLDFPLFLSLYKKNM